ncbi:chalcone isomerase family protein [Silvimonas sp.]|uniref:chalcone isomerase family protein n=1 Tax=Silvimonas sp. TaxID=2650811 RepID=UPI0028497E4D|nr:chalcone isomerase family protein [Silvimonas sp.]MDR3426331.1 chalcone isomerase family protein [Silvimonas sp.]
MKLKQSCLLGLTLAAALALSAADALALEIGGQSVTDHAEVAGQNLQLDGAGMRKKIIFDVYVAALYSANKTTDANAVINGTAPRRMELRMMRGVSASTMHESFVEGLKANVSEAQLAALKPKIGALEKIFNEVKAVEKGDLITMDFIPGQGTKVSVRGKVYPLIAGDDFSAAMLSIWLGPKPVQDNLKAALLGKPD